MMKKIMFVLLSIAMLLSFVACGDSSASDTVKNDTDAENTDVDNTDETMPDESPEEEDEPDIVTYALGETVSTDMVEFTLDTAKFTICVESSHSDSPDSDFFLPTEFDPNDINDLYTAATGSTYVAFSYSVTNIGRSKCIPSYTTSRCTVTHGDTVYTSKVIDIGAYSYHQPYSYINLSGSMVSDPAYVWYRVNPGSSHDITLNAGDGQSVRCVASIPANIENLEDDFNITLKLIASESYEGETEFTYAITAEDRAAILEVAALQ